MKADMKDVVGITTTRYTYQRFLMLYCTMSCVLSNVSNFLWYVIVPVGDRDKIQGHFMFDMIMALASINNNVLIFTEVSEDKSVGQNKIEFLKTFFYRKEQRKYAFNIDDDMLYDGNTFYLINRAITYDYAHVDFFILTQFDVDNRRKFKDYDSIVRSVKYRDSFEDFIKEKGERVVAHHLWETDYGALGVPFGFRLRAMSSGWIVKISKILEITSLVEGLSNWKKGERGYDIFMCTELIKRKIIPMFIVDSRGYHVGLETNYYSKSWTTHEDKIRKEWEEAKFLL